MNKNSINEGIFQRFLSDVSKGLGILDDQMYQYELKKLKSGKDWQDRAKVKMDLDHHLYNRIIDRLKNDPSFKKSYLKKFGTLDVKKPSDKLSDYI